MSHNIVYLSVHVNNLMGQLKKCANIDNKFSKSFSDHYFNNIWHSFNELMSWVWMHMISRINKYIWGSTLFDCQMNIRRCRAKKVSTFLREIFVPARREKASKVVDDSRGKFCWIVRGSLERVVNPGFCCISHPPTCISHIWISPTLPLVSPTLPHLKISHPPTSISHPPTHLLQVNSFAQSDLILGRGVFLGFLLAEKTSKLGKGHHLFEEFKAEE